MILRAHDTFFKDAFEIPEHAAGLFRGVLPPALTRAIAWPTLRQEPGSFVAPDFAERHTDLLFRARLRGDPACVVYLYLLLEHQSTNDPIMVSRMLGYIQRIVERHYKLQRKPPLHPKIPLVLPVVLAQVPGGWTAPVRYVDLLDPHPDSIPELGEYVPKFSILVEDLSRMSNEELMARSLAAFPKLVLWALRNGRDDPSRLAADFLAWAPIFVEALHAQNGAQACIILLRYLSTVSGVGIDVDQFFDTICTQMPESKEVVMTFAEQLLSKGRNEGRNEGLVRSLEKLLTLKFGALSPDDAARLRAASPEQVERMLERILGANSLAAVFDGEAT